MKVYLYEGEYGDYTVVDETWKTAFVIDMPQSKRDELIRVTEEFERVQHEVRKLVEDHRNG